VSAIRFERLHPDVTLPHRASAHAAGYDLRAYLTGTPVELRTGGEIVRRDAARRPDVRDGTPFVELAPGAVAKIPLGFRSQLPEDVEAQIRPRSGTSFKTDLTLPNSPGTVDADYRGEWMVLVRNVGAGTLRVVHGDAIAQVVFARVLHLAVEEGEVDDTPRGAGGFGSTDASARR
jgi:dUTP pyrophosphatase